MNLPSARHSPMSSEAIRFSLAAEFEDLRQ